MRSASSKTQGSPIHQQGLENLTLEERAARLADLLGKCQQELAELTPAAAVGTATLGIAHELGNCLNSMMLQASIIQMQAPADLKEKIAAFRNQGAQAAALLRPLQRLRHQGKETLYPVDVNAILREVLAEKNDCLAQFRVDEAPDLPPLLSTRAAALRLFRFLRDGLLGLAASPTDVIRGETSRQNGGGKFALTLKVLLPEPTALKDLFCSGEGLFANMDEIDRLAIQSLMRMLDVALHAANLEKQGLTLELTWK
jgi:hypothetical protein